MVHNGIEYGLMAAYAEGLSVLCDANIGKQPQNLDAETTPLRDPEHYQYDLNLGDIAEVWRRGSVIASWLLDLTADALTKDSNLSRDGCRTPVKAGGRLRPPATKVCLYRCSPRRFMRDSLPAARHNSRASCSPLCATGSAAI